jgi:alanine racemase
MIEAVNSELTLTVIDLENVRTLEKTAAELEKTVQVHLKIETGMGRIGVAPEDATELTREILENCPHLKLTGVMTHLPVSDEANTSFTDRQISRFKKIVKGIEKELDFEFGLVHCANSGAVLAHSDGWLDMVRPGIMIYGFYPSNETPQTIDLKPGLSFKTRVSFIKKVEKGTSIGYGRTWIAAEDTWVATFPAGYADGFNRLFSNSGRVLINGKSYPVVGRVCMDQSMCNLGKETEVEVGDRVTLIGDDGDESISAYEWAEKLNTITYEVTCQINSRVKRYFDPF